MIASVVMVTCVQKKSVSYRLLDKNIAIASPQNLLIPSAERIESSEAKMGQEWSKNKKKCV